jgi:dUTP pyrophosphatase
MILTKDQIRKLIVEQDMVTGYIDLETQLQPNGFDLTIKQIYNWREKGCIDFDNKKRVIANFELTNTSICITEVLGWRLKTGSYLFQVNEIIKLPNNICAISSQRSSLMRNGVITNIGLWDCGYSGQGYSILNVLNPYGIRIMKNARVITMWFFESDKTEGYEGIFQHEGVKEKDKLEKMLLIS